MNSNILNKNSKNFSNNKEQKKINAANTEQIFNINDNFKNIYNNQTGRFDYLQYYNALYENETDTNYILNKLLKEHYELNYINYIIYYFFKHRKFKRKRRKKIEIYFNHAKISLFKDVHFSKIKDEYTSYINI